MGFTIRVASLLLPALAMGSLLHEKQGSHLNVAMFQLLDQDKSGFVEDAEGLSGFDSWKTYDSNKDGKLCLAEFSALGHEAQRLEEASLLEEEAKKAKSSARARCIPGSPKDIFMFELADKDKSGFIEENEGMSAFDWKVFDNDKDGKLSPKEFMLLVQESLRLEDEGPELKDEERRFSAPINRHDASMSEGASMMRGRGRAAQVPKTKGTSPPHAPNEQLPQELSAFEEDHWNSLSEYFGPFRIGYDVHTIDLPGWNFVVVSPNDVAGRGLVTVGNQNFASDSSNSFIAGHGNTARGRMISVVGGKDNVAEGVGVVIVGGEQNAARGNYTVLDGGYRNEVTGNYAVVEGGVKNVAAGDLSVVSGGQSNAAIGTGASITGGKANEASGHNSAIHGGAGNKAKGDMSSIGGGIGQSTDAEGEAVFVPLSAQDRETVQDPDHVGQHFTS